VSDDGRWGYPSPIETDSAGEFSGTGDVFGGWPYDGKCPVPQAERVVVDKRTHRIRFEGETENEVTIVIEPK
jgi:hypothetical protein